MHITGLGTANPPHRYTQAQCYDALRASPVWDGLAGRSQAILRKVLLGQNGIETRHFALPVLTEVFQITPDVMMERFSAAAPALAEQAARAALEDAGLKAEDAGALIIATCTGYSQSASHTARTTHRATKETAFTIWRSAAGICTRRSMSSRASRTIAGRLRAGGRRKPGRMAARL